MSASERWQVPGVAMAFIACALFSVGDALAKSLGGQLSVFEIGLFATGTGCIVAALLKPRGQSWREALRMQRPWAVEARALAGVTSSALGIYSFTRLPLSEAYSLLFLAPVFIALFGAVVHKETVTPARWLGIAVSFAGVLLAVRPGFEVLSSAHFAAAGAAVSTATGITILRALAAHESRTAVLFVMMGNAFLFFLAATLIGPGFERPDAGMLARAVVAGTFGTLGQFALLASARTTPASRIAPAQYSQLLWAVLIGVAVFGDYPDAFTLAGLAMIAVGGLVSARAGLGLRGPR